MAYADPISRAKTILPLTANEIALSKIDKISCYHLQNSVTVGTIAISVNPRVFSLIGKSSMIISIESIKISAIKLYAIVQANKTTADLNKLHLINDS